MTKLAFLATGFGLCCVLSSPTLTCAQTTSATTASSALAQEQADLDARLKILQDQAAIATAGIPASTTAPQSGAYTVNGNAAYQSQKLAYQDLNKVAGKIVAQVMAVRSAMRPASAASSVVIYDSNEIAALAAYQTMKKAVDSIPAQIKNIADTYEKQVTPELKDMQDHPADVKPRLAFAVPFVAMAALKSASDLLGMFRTNTSITYSSFTVDDVALTGMVSAILKTQNIPTVQPATMPLILTGQDSDLMTEIAAEVNSLADLQFKLSTAQADVQRGSDAIGSWIAALTAAQGNRDATAAAKADDKAGLNAKQPTLDLTERETREYVRDALHWPADVPLTLLRAARVKADRDLAIKQLATLNAMVTTTSGSLSTLQAVAMGATTAAPNGATILRAEALYKRATTDDALILYLKSAVLGGSVVTRVNLFTGGHLMYTGGAIANYSIYDLRGTVLASGTEIGDGGSEKDSY